MSTKISLLVVIDRSGKISEIFVAPDSELTRSKIETISSVLDIRSVVTTEKEVVENLIGRHKWDVLEYDKFKFIKLYPGGNLDHKMIVVIAACYKRYWKRGRYCNWIYE